MFRNVEDICEITHCLFGFYKHYMFYILNLSADEGCSTVIYFHCFFHVLCGKVGISKKQSLEMSEMILETQSIRTLLNKNPSLFLIIIPNLTGLSGKLLIFSFRLIFKLSIQWILQAGLILDLYAVFLIFLRISF